METVLSDSILILGIGNILLGDEGIGIHAVRSLEQTELPEQVEVLDGGTGGFHLLSYFSSHSKVILIDATLDGRPPGTITLVRPKYASDFPQTLSAHEIGLKDLIESAALLDELPEVTLIAVSIQQLQGISTELSPEVESTIPSIVNKVKEILNGYS